MLIGWLVASPAGDDFAARLQETHRSLHDLGFCEWLADPRVVANVQCTMQRAPDPVALAVITLSIYILSSDDPLTSSELALGACQVVKRVAVMKSDRHIPCVASMWGGIADQILRLWNIHASYDRSLDYPRRR